MVNFYSLQMRQQEARPLSSYYNGKITSVLMDTHMETHIASNSINSNYIFTIFNSFPVIYSYTSTVISLLLRVSLHTIHWLNVIGLILGPSKI